MFTSNNVLILTRITYEYDVSHEISGPCHGVFTVQQHGNYIQNRRKKPNFYLDGERERFTERIRVKKLNAD